MKPSSSPFPRLLMKEEGMSSTPFQNIRSPPFLPVAGGVGGWATFHRSFSPCSHPPPLLPFVGLLPTASAIPSQSSSQKPPSISPVLAGHREQPVPAGQMAPCESPLSWVLVSFPQGNQPRAGDQTSPSTSQSRSHASPEQWSNRTGFPRNMRI